MDMPLKIANCKSCKNKGNALKCPYKVTREKALKAQGCCSLYVEKREKDGQE